MNRLRLLPLRLAGTALCLFCLLCIPHAAMGQTDSARMTHRFEVAMSANYLTPTHRFFKGDNRKGSPLRTVLDGHLRYAFRFPTDTRYGRLYPHAYQGIGVACHSFLNPQELGTPVTLYVYQGSRIAYLSPRLTLGYEWSFGASFGWKPYDSENNLYNKVVGSPTNAYLNAAFLLNYRLSPHWALTGGVEFTHFSNGNTSYPNAGVNPVGVRIGVVHTPAATSESSSATSGTAQAAALQPRRISVDVLAYASVRKRGFIKDGEAYMPEGVFGILGANINPLYRVNRYFKAGASVDIQYDESANIKEHIADTGTGGEMNGDVMFYRPSFREQFSIGLSARGELSLPIFAINAGIGYNVMHRGGDTRGFYQVLALKAFVTRRFFIHTGYQLHRFKYPNNLMLGLGIRL